MSSYAKWAEEERKRRAGQEPVSYEEKPYWKRLKGEIPKLALEESKAYTDYTAISEQLRSIGMPLTAEVFRRIAEDEQRHSSVLKDLLRAPILELRRPRP